MEAQLASEAREAAAGARQQLEIAGPALAELAERLRAHPPALVVTCARGSSDHAATFGKYLLETTVDRLVASVGPSVASMYRRIPVGLEDALVIVVSQSGRSPDVLALTETVRRSGALVVGFINDETSPLTSLCDVVVPLCAGPERAVAATKSFVLAGLAFVQLAAAWTDEPALREAVSAAPELFEASCASPWDLGALSTARDLYVLGRGIGLGAAAELALKLKETCRIHAEAFSAAEVEHGPIALIEPGFQVIALDQRDETSPALREVLARLAGLGATIHAPPDTPAPPLLAPLCHALSFYVGLPALAAARGLDPDRPRHLTKVTRTR